MKATKKIVCLTLAIVIAALAFIMPVSAADATPLVIVDGFISTKLYQKFGTEEEKPAFPGDETDTETMIMEAGGAFLLGCASFGLGVKDYESLAGWVTPVINKYLEPIGYNTDGTPKNDTIGFYRSTEAIADYSSAEKANLTSFATETAKGYGEENTYNFAYDWRADPTVVADELNEYIGEIKDKTNSKKVNVVALSLGSAIVLAYLAEYGGRNINNLVFASPAWQGTSLAGDAFTGNIDIDVYAFENFMVGMSDGSATTHIIAVLLSSLATSEEFTEEWFLILEKAIEGMEPRIYSDIIVPMLAGMPGLWCLVPADYYEDAKAFLFPEGVDADLLAKIDAYNEIQTNAKQIIEDAEDAGMKFAIVCGYNRQIAPINDNLNTSDMVVDTKYASGGATCADYLTAFSDWDFGGKGSYTQAKPDGHFHISWDYKIDASTCMFPEQTWFIKNLQHVAYGTYEDDGTCDIVMWLLSMKKQHTVFTDKENYPQFSLYNTYKRFTKGINVDTYLGDVNHDYLLTTADARLALKMAAGLVDIPEDEDKKVIIDANEDGEISTDDARYILCWAAGISTDELY